MKAATLEALCVARAAKSLTALVTDLETGAETLFVEGRQIHEKGIDGLAVGDRLATAVREASQEDKSLVVEDDSQRYLIRVFSPPQRLFIIGAVHIAQSLSAMAREAGYAVTLIDPRDTWATPERFPDIDIDRRWPDESLADLAIDRRTALVALSHDPKLDDPALTVALRSDCFYIGSLGRKKTNAARLTRLTEAGFTADDFSRIHGPIGLDIGAKTPAEIAVAVMGEITVALRRGPQG